MNFGATELLLVLLVVVVLFGATLLPKLARGIAETRRELGRSKH